MGAAASWRTAADRLDRATAEAAPAGAVLLRARLLAAFSRDMGGDLRLSGGGGPVGVDVRARAGGDVSTADVTATGRPAKWVEFGTGPGRPQGGSSPARRSWSRTVASTMPTVEADMERRLGAALR